jgi:hypothetical protein
MLIGVEQHNDVTFVPTQESLRETINPFSNQVLFVMNKPSGEPKLTSGVLVDHYDVRNYHKNKASKSSYVILMKGIEERRCVVPADCLAIEILLPSLEPRHREFIHSTSDAPIYIGAFWSPGSPKKVHLITKYKNRPLIIVPGVLSLWIQPGIRKPLSIFPFLDFDYMDKLLGDTDLQTSYNTKARDEYKKVFVQQGREKWKHLIQKF